MNKIAVIMPYFGKLPNYFDLWLESCCNNPQIDWIVVTDNLVKCDSDNVKILNISFEDFKNNVQSKFNFKIKLDAPYKLCDYRPLYGYIFEEFFTGYDFWGWCDCDVIFGNLMKILPENVWNDYDRILDKGHLSFVKNSKDINELIFSESYIKTIITGKAIYAFDEIYNGYYKGFNQMLLDNRLNVFDGKYLVSDIDYRNKYFRIVEEDNPNNIFQYTNGTLYKYSVINDEVTKKEVLYIHMQKRQMDVCTTSNSQYFIIPNKFDNTIQESDITKESIFNFNVNVPNYFNMKKELNWYRKREIQRFLHEPHKIEAIKYVIKNR